MKPCGPFCHDDQPHHSFAHHNEVMHDSLEEGQLLEDDPHLSDSVLNELGRFGMEGLGCKLGGELGGWEQLSG